ncbi:MAG: tryptophan--tRNA ligase [Candidatus Sumerlaeaceae bacterium]
MTTRILSGMRSTGRLHVGHYLGALKNWVRLQDEGNECFFMVADWHALTSDYADPGKLRENMKESVLGWLGAGLDPERCTIFVQSLVKEHAELALLLGMFTPTPWLERNPSYKDQIMQLANKDLETYGFLGYPVLQAADILIYRAHAVPIGEDQLPHLELTREIARRVNFFHGGPIESGTNRPLNPIFPEPEPILSHVPKLSGLDGRKMSKSYDNGIYLNDTEADVATKVKSMITDTTRVRRSDPGHPENCTVCHYQTIFNPDKAPELHEGCRTATLGCVDCKRELASAMNNMLSPMRERRAAFESKPKQVVEILAHGTNKARAEAQKTMQVLRQRLNLVESVEQAIQP